VCSVHRAVAGLKLWKIKKEIFLIYMGMKLEMCDIDMHTVVGSTFSSEVAVHSVSFLFVFIFQLPGISNELVI